MIRTRNRFVAPVAGLLLMVTADGAPAARAGAGVATDALAGLPLRYEENLGQTDARASFVARAAGYRVFLAGGAPESGAGRHEPIALLAPHPGGSAIGLRVLGMAAMPTPRASHALPGRSHYFRGSDPANWQRGVRGYARVHYDAILPGIDLVFHGSSNAVEFDFVVEPGSDPDAIALGFEGVDSLRLEPGGALALAAVDGTTLRVHAPFVYQDVDGERRPVEGRFDVRKEADGRVEIGFALGRYDAGAPLVIDPVLSFSTYLGGGTSSDEVLALDVDADGNTYVTGFTSSTDYPTTAGALDTTANGGVDAFVTKLSPDGASLVYSTYFGGNLDENFTYAGIAVDSAGRAHIAGVTTGGTFPTTAGAYQGSSNGGSECYVAKLSADGSALVYSTFLGGSSNDRCRAIALDDTTGRVYVTGIAQGNFPTSMGAFDTTLQGASDAFVAAFDAGGALVYSTYVGGSGSDEGYDIALVGQDAVITGETFSTDFPTQAAFQPGKGGHFDAFLTRLNATGTAVVVSTYVGGSAADLGSGVATDGAGAMYVTGETDSTDFPTSTGAFQESDLGGDDAFVVKVTATGSLAFATYLGGASTDRGTAIAVRNQAAVVMGETRSADFPTVDPIQPSIEGISSDGFVSLFSYAGDALDFSTYLGGGGGGGSGFENNRSSTGLVVDVAGALYVAGTTTADDFPTTAGAYLENDPANGVDSYVAKITLPAAAPVPVLGAPALVLLGIALAASIARATRVPPDDPPLH